MKNSTYFKANQKLWNQRVETHVESDFYRMKDFMQGWNSLDDFSFDFLGNIHDQSILHLQCHFGQDTMSMSRMGARVTGLDFSKEAIARGIKIAEELKLDTKFVESSVYNLQAAVQGCFDIVFTSYGCIVWLPDLDRWASLIRKKLSKGGRLILIDFHPLLMMYDFKKSKLQFDYFNRSVIHEEVQSSYVDVKDKTASDVMDEYSWSHSISEIFNACRNNGLDLIRFEEYDYAPYPIFPIEHSERDRHYQFIAKPSFPHCMAMEFKAI